MLVSAKEMLDKAKAGHYAVGQFNINNLEWTKAILLTAQELNSPVILGVSEGAGKYMTGFGTVAAMVRAMDEELGITVPVALHLDHGTYEGCYKCIKAGFTSIMFDGSHYPFEENLAKSTELVNVAHGLGLSIECEVGSIGGEEDGVVGMGECADPNECKTIADLGVDMLAFNVSQRIEEVRDDQLLPVIQRQGVCLDQVLCQLGVHLVQLLLNGKDLLHLIRVPGKADLARPLDIVQRHRAEADHFLGKSFHRDTGLVEDSGIQLDHGSLGCLLRIDVRLGLGDQDPGQLDQLLREREQDQGHAELEAGVEQGDLHRRDLVERDFGTRREQNEAQHAEQDRADDVEGKMDDRRPLRCPAAADGGKQRGDAGADVLTEGDEDGRVGGDQPVHRQSLQDTDGDRGALQERSDQRAGQHAQQRVGAQGREDRAEDRGAGVGLDGVRHEFQALEEEADADDDLRGVELLL